jgi:hypothetical protein
MEDTAFMADDQTSRPPYLLLAICAGLICFGILTIAVAPGFFMNLLGAGIFAAGGSAAYLILSHRDNEMRRS